MTYMKIRIDLIDPNPFQPRQEYDDEVTASIALSAMGRHGILQPPMVRPHGDRYQVAFGHGRIRAVKSLGKKKIDCRVEEITDAEMKKYVLQENVLRSDLSEDERMTGIETYREELGLKKGDPGFYVKLSQETGLSEIMVQRAYYVKETRNRLKKHQLTEGVKAFLILQTKGLPPEEQDQLIIKSLKMGWSSDTAFKVKQAMKTLSEETKKIILDPDKRLPQNTITKLATLTPEQQEKALSHIRLFRLNEKDSVDYIEKVKLGLIYKQPKEITFNYYDRIERTFYTIRGWGVPMIIAMGSEEWSKALPYVKGINEWTTFLLKLKGDKEQEATPPKPPKLELKIDETKIIDAVYTAVQEKADV